MSVIVSKQLSVPSLGKPISDYAVGESVFLNVNGTKTEFLVVHQGLPSSLYDTSCDGTWLLMKDLHEQRSWDGTNNDYKNSDIHTYLNGTFLGLLDAAVQSKIKQVKIPYHNGTGNSGSVASGANGLSTKIFLISGYEVGWTTSNNSNFPVDGACLSYFNGADYSKRIAYLDGTATVWWLRSPSKAGAGNVWSVVNNGTYADQGRLGVIGVRPALILPYNAKFDPDTNEFIVSNNPKYVNYIESTGTQYIDTKFVPNNNTRIVMDIQASEFNNRWLFGSRTSSTSASFAVALMSTSTVHSEFGATNTTATVSGVTERVTVDKNKNECRFGSVAVTNTAVTFSGTYPIYLLSLNNGGNAATKGFVGKLYSCKIYDNGTLVRDFKPCRDKSGVACLYDEVTKSCFYNAGTGAFTTG